MTKLARRFLNTNPITSMNVFDPFMNSLSPYLQETARLNSMISELMKRGHQEEQNEYASSAYLDRTPDNERFSIWTKGTYPKLNIYKVYESIDSSRGKENPRYEKGQLKGIRILAAVPGYDKEDVSVEANGNELVIELRKKELDETSIADRQKRELEDMSQEIIEAISNEIPTSYHKMIVGLTGPFVMEDTKAEFLDDGMVRIDIPAKTKEVVKSSNRNLLK